MGRAKRYLAYYRVVYWIDFTRYSEYQIQYNTQYIIATNTQSND